MPTLDLPPGYLRMLLEILERHAPGVEVWAYGSRVTGGAHEGSDLDLVLRQPERLNESQPIQALKAALSESNLPILVDVLDWARIPETFRRDIERRHLVVRSAEHADAK